VQIHVSEPNENVELRREQFDEPAVGDTQAIAWE